MQTYRELPAPAPLAGAVACLWAQAVSPGDRPLRHRTVPHAAVEIRAGLDGSGPVWVAGPRRRAVTDSLAPGTTVVGLRLRPGAAAGLFGVPAAELTDRRLPLSALWARAGETLADRLAGAGSARAALRLLARAVAGRLAESPVPDRLVAEAVRRLGPWPGRSVGQVAAGLGVTDRHLRRRCLSTVGHSPRTIQRILRFQGFLALAHAAGRGGARDPGAGRAGGLAAAAGYADQAHLSRTCAELTGLSPRTFLAETARLCGPSHDHAATFAPLLAARTA